MLCSPLKGSGLSGCNGSSTTANGKLGASLNDTNNNRSCNNIEAANRVSVGANCNGFISNNAINQQNYESNLMTTATKTTTTSKSTNSATATTIREIKSRNIGSLSPLCQNVTTVVGSISSSHLIFERRQAISMERLNSIHQSAMRISNGIRDNSSNGIKGNNTSGGGHSKENLSAGGSLSSGSNTSLDELMTDETRLESPVRATGLTRSASRVSRFKSAKEFFERLSSINSSPNGSSSHSNIFLSPPKPPLPERPRGNVVNRYSPNAKGSSPQAAPAISPAKSSSHMNLNQIPVTTTTTTTNITTSQPSPPRSRPLVQISPYVSSTATPLVNGFPKASPISPNTTASSMTTTTTTIVTKVDANNLKSKENMRSSEDSPQSPKLDLESFVFEGDNVIVGNGSLLNRRNKQLKIKFDENSTLTYEYPSEEVMLAEPDSPTPPPSPAIGDQRATLESQQASNKINTSAHVKKSGSNALSSYKPSSLLVAMSDNDIDNKLGVKNLVTPSRSLPVPIAKSRFQIDTWSANNGSIMYAQSNSVKAVSNLTNTNHNNHMTATDRWHQESQTTVGRVSALSAMYLGNGAGNRIGTINSQQSDTATIKEPSTNNGATLTQTQDAQNTNRNTPRHLTNSTQLSNGKQQQMMTATNGLLATESQDNFDEDDLSNGNTTNWSNGTCTTSDLLF